MKTYISSVVVFAIILTTFAFTGGAVAQDKGASALHQRRAVINTPPASVETRTSVVQGKSTFLKSSVQSLGFVGSHEIILAKSASLYGANLSVIMSYNSDGSLTMLAASGVPGIAGTVIANGAEAGAAYLFGAGIRSDNSGCSTSGSSGVTINNDNTSAASNNNANSNRNANNNRNSMVARI
jgi:hypothetical protein